MTQQQRILGMLTGILMMVGGIVLLATSIGWIWRALPSDGNSGEIAAGATATITTTQTVSATHPVSGTLTGSTATPVPLVTATFTDLTLNPTVTPIPPSATPAPSSPTTLPTQTTTLPTTTPIPTSTFTPLPPTVTATATAGIPTSTATIALSPTVSPPPQITLETTPIPTVPDDLTASACASLDNQTQAGLYQVETPAQIGVEQRLCLGGYPMDETISVYLTGRSALTVLLQDEDGNGFGYAEVRYVPTRADRNRPLNMTAAGESVTASGQITIEPTIPGVGFAPRVGNSFTTFYAVLTFPDNAPRNLYLYRRTDGDTFTYIRQIFLLPQSDNCVPFNPCFASDITLSRESAGEYRFVEYSPTAGFRLFPSDLAPLGFVVVNPEPTSTPGTTPESTATATAPLETPTSQPELTVTSTLPVPTETPTVEPTLTLEPTTTPQSTATPDPTATAPAPPLATSTPIITASEW